MAYINEQELNELRSACDIVDIISSYIPLTLKGKNYFGVCPFHDDHSPSMSVSKDKQMYKCFSCGEAGNVFTFVQNFENVSFSEAINIVANKVGFNLSSKVNVKKSEKYFKEYDILDLACKFYQNKLNSKNGTEAISYLTNRGLSKEDIMEFEIGLSLNDNTLNKFLLKKGYEVGNIKGVGLVSENNNSYDIFYDRIIFPIHNADGKVVALSGRVYKDDAKPKYLGTKESIIYHKSNILFNYHRAKDEAKLKKEIIVVEGYMDAIRLYISGIKNVVALMGTALTTNQIELLKKLKCKVILMLDNDDAGEKATFDAINLLENKNFNIGVVRLSGKKDPDEYILENGIDKMVNAIKNAISITEFKLQYLKKDKNLNNTEELVKYIKVVLDDVNKSNDDILKEVTLKKLSEEYDISYDVLVKQLDESSSKNKEIIKVEEKTTKKRNSYIEALRNILYYMMSDSLYIKMYIKKLGYIDEKIYRLIASEIIYYYEKNNTINIADFITYAETSKIKDEIMDIIGSVTNENLDEKVFIDSINLIKKKTKQREIEDLKEELRKTMDENRKEELLKKIIEIKIGSGE